MKTKEKIITLENQNEELIRTVNRLKKENLLIKKANEELKKLCDGTLIEILKQVNKEIEIEKIDIDKNIKEYTIKTTVDPKTKNKKIKLIKNEN